MRPPRPQGGTVGEPRCGHHSTPTPSNPHCIIDKPHTTYNNPMHISHTSQPYTLSQSTPTVRNPSSVNGNKRELSKVDMFCSSTSREGRRVRDERRHRHPLAAEPGEARSDTVRRRGRKPGRTGGRRRRKGPPPNLHKTPPHQTQGITHHQWDIHKVGLSNKNRTTIETSKHTIPTGKRLILEKLLQTQGKGTGKKQTIMCHKMHTNKKVLQP